MIQIPKITFLSNFRDWNGTSKGGEGELRMRGKTVMRTNNRHEESHSLVPIHFEAVIFILNAKKENPEEAFNSINASLDWNERL